MEVEDRKLMVPIWEKELLSVKEAVAYFGIGEHKIREMTDGNNLNVRGLRYSNLGVDCQMEVAFGFAVDTDGFMVVYPADYLL